MAELSILESEKKSGIQPLFLTLIVPDLAAVTKW
jgi:hypothetical protein